VDFHGSYLLLAKRQTVWRALNDTSVLKSAIPGCHHIEWVSKTSLDLSVKINLGIVHPVFAGELRLSDVEAAKNYVLSGRGHGKILGLAQGSAAISLSDVDQNSPAEAMGRFVSELKQDREISSGDEITWLRFSARGGASPRIMALGSRIVGASAQKIIDRFFIRFADAMDTRVCVLPPGMGKKDDPNSP